MPLTHGAERCRVNSNPIQFSSLTLYPSHKGPFHHNCHLTPPYPPPPPCHHPDPRCPPVYGITTHVEWGVGGVEGEVGGGGGVAPK